MNGNERGTGVVQTVTGRIASSDVGMVLPHEHLFLNMNNYFTEPTASEAHRASEPVTLENLHWVRYNHLSNRDNLVLDNEDLAVSEVERFRELGGQTIVDVTPINLGRMPDALARVSQRTGVNIVMGAGYYIDQSYTPDLSMGSRSDEDIAQEFIREIREGVGEAKVKAGLIGELGCSWPLTDNERTVLRGAAFAQNETGATVSIHPGHVVEAPFEILSILTEAGADPSKVIMGHIELTMPIDERKSRARLAETGCYLEFDQMGISELQMHTYRKWLPGIPYMDLSNDGVILSEVRDLIEDGFAERVLISQDVCMKTCLAAYGGPGYGHIPEFSIGMMRDKGFSEDLIAMITVDNPTRALTVPDITKPS